MKISQSCIRSEWKCAATKTPRNDNASREGFALGARFPALWAWHLCRFCNARAKKNLNNWKNLNSVRPFITRISIRGSGRNRGHFFLRGGRVIPSCPPALGATVPTPRTPNPEPHLPPRPPSPGGPEKVTEKGAKTMTPPRLYEIDEIDEIDEKNRRNRRN